MLTLYASPNSRATRMIQLVHALGIEDDVDIRRVTIARRDGSGGPDPANPHPEGKVPLLVDDGVAIWESSAIMLYLTDLVPESPLGVPVGHRERGRYLSWLAWYGDVIEPVLALRFAGLDHPVIRATFRGWDEVLARLGAALKDSPWLVAGRYTAADMLIASAFLFTGQTPEDPAIADWLARCTADPSLAWARAQDAAA